MIDKGYAAPDGFGLKKSQNPLRETYINFLSRSTIETCIMYICDFVSSNPLNTQKLNT